MSIRRRRLRPHRSVMWLPPDLQPCVWGQWKDLPQRLSGQAVKIYTFKDGNLCLQNYIHKKKILNMLNSHLGFKVITNKWHTLLYIHVYGIMYNVFEHKFQLLTIFHPVMNILLFIPFYWIYIHVTELKKVVEVVIQRDITLVWFQLWRTETGSDSSRSL